MVEISKSIEDKEQLFKDYIAHQEYKLNFAIRITDYMRDYETRVFVPRRRGG